MGNYEDITSGVLMTETYFKENDIEDTNGFKTLYKINRRFDLKYDDAEVRNVDGDDNNTKVFEIVDNVHHTDNALDIALNDSFGEPIQATMGNQLMVASNTRLVGGVFNGSTPDTNFYTTTNVASGIASIINSELILTTTADSGSSSLVYTNSKARCIGGNMNEYRERVRLDVLDATNNTRRWGLFETNSLLNAVYFEFKNGILYLIAKTNGLDDIIYQTDYVMDTNYHLYTINYVNGGFRLYIDDKLIYDFKETNRIICGTRHLRAFSQNINTGVGSGCHLYGRFMTILMYGNKKTQPKSKLIEGLNAGILLKTGVGSLHIINLSGVTNTSNVTVYDGTSTAGTKIYTTGAMGPQTAPLQVPFNDGINFEDGLFITITGANCNAQVIYE